MAPAMFDAGAPMQPTMEAISSSRDGISDTALTPATSRAFSPIAPPRITNFSFSLAKSSSNLGRSHRVLGIGQNGHTRQEVSNACAWLTLKGDFGEPVFGNTHRPPLRVHARAGPAFQQLSDRRSGQPQRRQSFQRSGRVRRPTVLFVLYPQFHSNFGGCPRLSSAEHVARHVRVHYGSRAKIARRPFREISSFPSQAGIKLQHPPSRTNTPTSNPDEGRLGPRIGKGHAKTIDRCAPKRKRRPKSASLNYRESLIAGRAVDDRNTWAHCRAHDDLLHVSAFGPAGLALATASTKARTFSTSLASSKDALPIPA